MVKTFSRGYIIYVGDDHIIIVIMITDNNLTSYLSVLLVILITGVITSSPIIVTNY